MHKKKKAVVFCALALGALMICGQPMSAQACGRDKDSSGPTTPAPEPTNPAPVPSP